MRRFKTVVAFLLVLPFVGTGTSWLAALHLMAHGNHHVTIDRADGRLAIVLEHHIDDHHDDDDGAHHAPASTHSHATDDDHVVTIASADETSVAPSRWVPGDDGPPVALGFAVGTPSIRAHAVLQPSRSRVGPPPPVRSSILRI